MRLVLAAFLVMAPLGVAAEHYDSDSLAERFGGITHTCLKKADIPEQEACIRKQAATCMETIEGGYSTLGMTMCTAAEAKVWDGLLNAEWPLVKAWAKNTDDADKEHFAGFARRAETLLAAQRAWITYRDAQCDLEYAQWGAGSMRQTAGAACMLNMTANRVLSLRSLRYEY